MVAMVAGMPTPRPPTNDFLRKLLDSASRGGKIRTALMGVIVLLWKYSAKASRTTLVNRK
jgi:hypothetical protein